MSNGGGSGCWQMKRASLSNLMLVMLRMSRLLDGRVCGWAERAVAVAAARGVRIVSREGV